MLVLDRKLGEQIRIGDDITVTVVRIDDNRIRLGVTAPRWILIHRDENYRRCNRCKVAFAAGVCPGCGQTTPGGAAPLSGTAGETRPAG